MSGFLLFVRLGFSLAIVIGLMWLAGRVMRNRGMGGRPRKGDAQLEVIDRKNLSKTASLALVRVGDRTLLVGVTEHGISNLTEVAQPQPIALTLVDEPSGTNGPVPLGAPAELPLMAAASADESGTAWKMLVDQLRERTVRRV
ncbi:MAG: FliO/MopB family protein [Acidimicrobiia bacterium]